MKAWQERVIYEQKELAEKIVKLITFITNNDNVKDLTSNEYQNLIDQFQFMFAYSKVLLSRINSFKEEE